MARQFSPNAPVRLAEHANHAVAHRIDRLTPLTMACGWRPSEPGVLLPRLLGEVSLPPAPATGKRHVVGTGPRGVDAWRVYAEPGGVKMDTRMRSRGPQVLVVVIAGLLLGGCFSGRQPAGRAVGSPSPSAAVSAAAPTATTTGLPVPAPDPTGVPAELLNPAVTQDTIHATICVAGWTAMVRPPTSYTNALKRAQLPVGANLAGYEEDHRIPLEIGGAPRNPVGDDGKPEVGGNLWAEPIDDARRKDRVENQLHTAVCAGTMSLAAARLRMYDWPAPLWGAP